MPCLDVVFTRLSGARMFSTLDLRSGCWQILLLEENNNLIKINSDNKHLECQVMFLTILLPPDFCSSFAVCFNCYEMCIYVA